MPCANAARDAAASSSRIDRARRRYHAAMPELLAAIDQGTTSTRCLVFEPGGRIVGRGQEELRQIYPRPGWVEHDPLEILASTERVVAAALADAGIRAADLAAAGITNQRETLVVWDPRSGKPYANALVWQDTRTRELCAELERDGGKERLRELCGLPPATYFSGPKLRWLLDHTPGLAQAAARGEVLAGTIDSWLVWNLGGGPRGGRHLTDPSNASRTMLMELGTLAWSDELCATLGVPRELLPAIVPSADAEAYGRTCAGGPFGGEVPLAAVLGDQQAALFGQACFASGQTKNTYGTGCFLLLNTGPEPVRSAHGLLSTVAWKLGDGPAQYALEGSVAIAGALVQWLRDELGILREAAEVETLARSVTDSGGVTIVPAFSGLFAPRWRADARGVIVGLTRYSGRAHLARAALEAVCHQVREVSNAMELDAGLQPEALKVDGGMTANGLLLELQAGLLDRPVVRAAIAETTSLGAAQAAGLARGVFASTDELAALWRDSGRFEPALDPLLRERMIAAWEDAVERSLGLA